jgi:hypothetical protein
MGKQSFIKSRVEITSDGNIAYLYGPGAIVSFEENPAGAKQTIAYLDPGRTGKQWAPWGADDSRPETIIKKVEKNVVASSGLEWLCDAFFGEGLFTYERRLENGKEIIIPTDFPEVKNFFKYCDINEYLEESIYDYIYFKNLFPEMYLGRGRMQEKIVDIRSKEAVFSRWGIMDPKSKRITVFFYSAEFPSPRQGHMATVPVFDPRKPFGNKKFIFRMRFASPGRTYYAKPAWHSVVDSGWLDVSNDIPKLKKNLLKNAMSLRYHIKIPKNYWSDKYKDWDKMTPDKQKELRQEELEQMNDFLTGVENVGKSFISHYGIEKRTGDKIPGWEIDKIDTSIPDGTLTTDQSEANAMILFALNIDPTLKGAGLPNNKQSAGSGSDKREAKLIFNSQMGMMRRRFLSPLYFIKKFNQWDERIEFGFRDMLLTTLDKNPTGVEKVTSG